MNPIKHLLDISCIEPSKEEILRYLGTPQKALTPSLDQLIDRSVALAKSKIRPRFVYGIFVPAEQDGAICLEGTTVLLQGKSIKQHLAGAKQVALFACTLGAEAESLIRSASVTDLTQAVVLDAIATELIEKACDQLERIIIQEQSLSAYHTNFRFSPGYGDLPLDVQPAILQALQAEKKIALTCNPQHIMVPRKSVTAMFGLFSRPKKRSEESPCESCQIREFCTKKEGDQQCGYKS